MSADFDREKERALVLGVRQNERAAFDELVAAFSHRGFAVAYSFVGNSEDAKDVVQEAFIRLYTRIGGFRESSRLSTWFYRIVVNCSLDLLRKRKRLRSRESSLLFDEEGNAVEPAGGTVRPEPLKDEEDLQALQSCVARLPERQRACFVLRHENGMSCAEIADTLHCTVSTVKVHIFRAVTALRAMLAEHMRKEA